MSEMCVRNVDFLVRDETAEEKELRLAKEENERLDAENMILRGEIRRLKKKCGALEDRLAAANTMNRRFQEAHFKAYRRSLDAQREDIAERPTRIIGGILLTGAGIIVGMTICVAVCLGGL